MDPSIVDDMATAAGFVVDADPALCAAIQVPSIYGSISCPAVYL